MQEGEGERRTQAFTRGEEGRSSIPELANSKKPLKKGAKNIHLKVDIVLIH